MALSNSYNYNVTAQEIVEGALRAIGVISSGETPTTDELADGLEAFNLLMKSWQHSPNPIMRGVQAWHRVEQTLDISALTAKQAYTLAPSGGDQAMQIPVDILDIKSVDSAGDEGSLEKVTFSEFAEWGNRTSTGTPTKWFYVRGVASGTLYFNVIPLDTTVDFRMTHLRPVTDADALTDDVEFTQEWFRALKFNLAVDIAPEYQIEPTPTLIVLAQQSLALANFVVPDDAAIFFQPNLD